MSDYNESGKEKQGKLKIFFGYAAGVGKTYAMLQAAHEAKNAGIDVVIGYVEPHMRPATLALLDGLEMLPVAEIEYKGVKLKEFDIDAALVRKPALILVDELAHTNAPGSRHLKRYQDVEELLKAGIDVYTTVNVQHMESINDVVESITGVAVRERIPDYIFNNAEHVELMDIEPDDLIHRLDRGEIYKEAQAQRALKNFFTPDNLTALRELSLRRTADRVNITAMRKKTKSADSPYIAGEHVLVCLSSSPSNHKVVRTAARMAEAFHCPFTALYVETSSYGDMSKEDLSRLIYNIKLAEQLGAKINTVYGDDIPMLVSDYAKINNISKIVIGRPVRRIGWFSPPNYIDKLSELAPDLEIFVIPNNVSTPIKKVPYRLKVPRLTLADTLKSFGFLALSTILGFIFFYMNFDESNIITVYILSVLFTAIATEGRVYSIVSSVLAVLAFNYFFAEPRFTLYTHDPGYPFTFLIMFISAFLTSTLTDNARLQAKALSLKTQRTEILLETSKKLLLAKTKDRIFHEVARQLIKLLDCTVILYPAQNDSLGEPFVKEANLDSTPVRHLLTTNERAVAEWVYKNNTRAGSTTDTLSNAKCLYLPVASSDEVLAVAGISMSNKPSIDAFEKNLLNAILTECALAIEGHAGE